MSDETTRIAAVAMNSAMGDPCTNLERIAEICHQAHALGAKFVLFPEECITGSLNKSDLTLKEARQIVLMASKKAVSCLKSLCRELGLEGRLFYRHRPVNLNFKSGNVADFLRRWGADYWGWISGIHPRPRRTAGR